MALADPVAIVEQVASAFPSAPVPSREDLFNDHCEECMAVSNAYGGRPWPEISLQDLWAGSATALLTPTAWRYYLPAMISWCVRDPESAGVVVDWLVYQFTPPKEGEADQWFRERTDGFTDAQRKAIVAYLVWYRDREAAGYAALGSELPGQADRALAYWAADGA